MLLVLRMSMLLLGLLRHVESAFAISIVNNVYLFLWAFQMKRTGAECALFRVVVVIIAIATLFALVFKFLDHFA